MDGRSHAAAIAHDGLARGAALSGALAEGLADQPSLGPRALAVYEAVAFLSGTGASPANPVPMAALLLVRHAASVLADDCGSDPYVAEGMFGLACRLHESLDEAAAALGASSVFLPDEDDWSIDATTPGDAAVVACPGLAETAGSAALFARDALSHAQMRAGRGGALMRRDAGVAVCASLALRAALSDPCGVPAGLLLPACAAASGALTRLVDAASSWSALAGLSPPASVLRDLAQVGAATRSILDEIRVEAHACAPRV